MKLWYDRKLWISPRAKKSVPDLDPAHVRSIAVIKHAALGDLVLTRPFLIELRRLFPNARITLALERGREWPWVCDDLDLDRHVAPGMNTKGAVASGIAGPFRSLRPGAHAAPGAAAPPEPRGPQSFDLLFDLTATPCSFWITRLTPARLKLGFQHRSWHRVLYDLAIPRTEYKFEAEVFLDFLNLFGHETEWPPDFGWGADEKIARAGRSRRADDARGPVLYFTGASTPAKSWPEDSFLKLIREARARFGQYEHVIWPGTAKWERERAARIAKETGASILNPGESMPEQGINAGSSRNAPAPGPTPVDIARGARLYVGNDTGVRHVAIATGTPTIGFFRTAPPFRYTPHTGGHQAVFARDGGDATVEQGLAAMQRALD